MSMTWGQLKKQMEEQGVADDFIIYQADELNDNWDISEVQVSKEEKVVRIS